MKISQQVSHEIPAAFLERMQLLLGAEYPAFLASLQQAFVTGLRVNILKVSPSRFMEIFPWPLSPVSWTPSGFTMDESPSEGSLSQPGKHPYHTIGLYYLQEPSAMAAAEVLAPLPGERVLDLAAAPGGKATHLAALMGNTGVLVANEIHPKRVWDLVENLERCGVTNSMVTNESPQRLAGHFGEYFDRVLLDAPCSGEGMFRKGEVARREWQPGLVHSCALRQSAILEQACRLVRPGGRLVYTTCTFSPDENEGVIGQFLDIHPEFVLDTIHSVSGFSSARPDWVGLPPDNRLNQAVRLWPHRAKCEGHFIAALVKRGTTIEGSGHRKLKKSPAPQHPSYLKPGKEVLSIFDEFCNANLDRSFDHSQLAIFGSYIYLLPDNPPDLARLQIIHPGWWLGSFSKGHFTPSHSLAMGIISAQSRHALSLTLGDSLFAAYLSGEIISDPGVDDWVLVTLDSYPIGWGKRVKGVLKNYYPHGLRQRK